MKSIIFALLSFLAMSAHAIDLPEWLKTADIEVSMGNNSFKMPPNGLYYQEHTRDHVPHRFDLSAMAFSVGISNYITRGTSTAWYDRGHDGIRWRVEYIDNGTVNSMAKGTSDVNYDSANRTCVTQPCALNTFATWSVKFRHRGFISAVAPEWAVGPGKLFIEAGVYWGLPEGYVTIDRSSGETEVYKYQGGLNAGLVFGTGYQYKNVQIFARAIHMDAVNDAKGVFEKDLPPNHEPGVFQVGVRVRF